MTQPTVQQRLATLESWKDEVGDLAKLAADVRAILSVVQRVKTLFNRWSIVMVTALVTSGVVGGPLGKFLAALLDAVKSH